MRLRAGWLLPFLFGGCLEELPPEGHIVLFIDTDAPLPPAPGATPDDSRPPPLFDRLRIDLYPAGASEPCDGCSREFDLDEAMINKGASITILAGDAAGSAPRARLRLFRGMPLGPEPDPRSTVEVVAQLPALPDERGIEVTAFLPTDSLGAPVGSLESPASPASGWSGEGHAGSWPPAQRVPCAGEGREGEVCVPGGAFWMGDRTLVDFEGEITMNAERLVVLSPYWIDDREVTVAAFRQGGGLGATSWSGDYEGPFGSNVADHCTFTAGPDASHDGLPINCLRVVAAVSFCSKQGKRLPTEAELEYIAGALSSSAHPWGADEPTCGDAVWGRFPALPDDPDLHGACFVEGAPPMPEPLVGGGGDMRPGRDRVELEGGVVYDLGGNVGEWSSDVANVVGEPCWPREGPQVFVDPVCTTMGSLGEQHVFRGGTFLMASYWTRAAARRAGLGSPETGFRCARSDTGSPQMPSCAGLAEDYADACGRCLEAQCCSELIDASGLGSTAVDDCGFRKCADSCAVTIAIECDASPPPSPVGECVELSGTIQCNPVTNEGCDTPAGATCDEAGTGFACFPPPNDVELCGACDNGEGPFCAPGSICLYGTGCAKYCCEDADCAPGICWPGEPDDPLFVGAPTLGVCVEG